MSNTAFHEHRPHAYMAGNLRGRPRSILRYHTGFQVECRRQLIHVLHHYQENASVITQCRNGLFAAGSMRLSKSMRSGIVQSQSSIELSNEVVFNIMVDIISRQKDPRCTKSDYTDTHFLADTRAGCYITCSKRSFQ